MKMIVFDLDGTLLTSNKTISDKSRTYLKKLKEMGYVTVIATGRMFESMKDVVQDFGFVDYIITDTGATCYDSGKSEIVFANPIDVDAAIALDKAKPQNFTFKANKLFLFFIFSHSFSFMGRIVS